MSNDIVNKYASSLFIKSLKDLQKFTKYGIIKQGCIIGLTQVFGRVALSPRILENIKLLLVKNVQLIRLIVKE